MAEREYHAVVIEWDGETKEDLALGIKRKSKTPDKFYDFLDYKGIPRIRGGGDKSLSITERRGGESKSGMAIQLQEGFVLCEKQSLADDIYAFVTVRCRDECKLALKMNVVLDLDQEVNLSGKDLEFLARYGDNHKRGRPSGEPVDWLVTCWEEAKSYEQNARGVDSCLHCGGSQIAFRQGVSLVVNPKPRSMSIWDYWRATRFSFGRFETPTVIQDNPVTIPVFSTRAYKDERQVTSQDNAGIIPAFSGRFSDPREESTYKRLEGVELVSEFVKANQDGVFSLDETLEILDALFCSVTHFEQAKRSKTRMEAVTRVVLQGYRVSPQHMTGNGHLDEFDLAPVMGASKTASVFMKMNDWRKNSYDKCKTVNIGGKV